MAYFDYNATSPLRARVKTAMIEATDIYGNPSSIHHTGRASRAMIDKSRDMIAAYLGVLPSNIIFTSSATEANHLILQGLEDVDVIITSEAEHDAILAPLQKTCAYKNGAVYFIQHHLSGAFCPLSFEKIINEIEEKKYKKPLLTLMKVNNETGLIHELGPFAEKIRAMGGYVHSDCVQAFGKIPFQSWIWQCDAITLGVHKVGGPKGIGALMLRDKIPLSPQIKGGGQEMSRRAGTQNIMGIAGFGALIDIISQTDDYTQELKRIETLRNFLEQEILNVNPNAVIVGHDLPRAGNVSYIITQGIESEKQVIIADLQKICLSSGAACSSGKVKSSHVLRSYGYDENMAQSGLRISLGFLTSQEECNELLDVYKKIFAKSKKA